MGKRFRIVEVDWVDSNVSYGWVTAKRAKETSDARPLTCRSVGYVLSEDEDDRLTLVMGQADNEDGPATSVSEVVSIPTVAILKVRDLK